VRRYVPLALLAVLLVGCSAPNGKEIVTPTPEKIVGKAPTPPAQIKGDPRAGKIVFNSNGCASCHTFRPAGSTGTIGPNLDDLAMYAQKAGQPLQSYTESAIVNPPAPYVPPGYPTNAMPTTFGTTLSAKQLADLVAFLTQGQSG
jgi:cytochrome c2